MYRTFPEKKGVGRRFYAAIRKRGGATLFEVQRMRANGTTPSRVTRRSMSASTPATEGQARTLRWFGAATDERGADSGPPYIDALFIAIIVLLSCAPYVGGLGLYSDDWAFMAVFDQAGGDSFAQLVAAILPVEMATRPLQALELSALYGLFGSDPLGYHVFNALVLATAVVLFHLSLRRLGFARVLALLIPLIFGLLPNYSTDRVWIAVFQANAAMALYFLSLFADLRFVASADARAWLWKALAAIALVGSVLAYEVTAPLLLLNLLVVAYSARSHPVRTGTARASHGRRPGLLGLRPRAPVAVGIGVNLALLLATIGYKFTTTVRADVSGGYALRVLRILREGVPVHFGELGIGLPLRALEALRSGPGVGAIAVAAVIGIAVGVYLLRVVLPRAPGEARGLRWPGLVLLGLVLFGAGYGVSLTTWEIGFHATGANNRTAIAAVPGVSCVFVGVLGWFSSLLPSHRARHIGLAVGIGLLAASATLVMSAIADAWVRAARVQDTVIADIRASFPVMDAGTTLLIDGLCPYVGPGPVFATGWDVSGMLQLVYDERDVRGDVLKPNSELTPAGVRTLLFDDVINVYPYGADLYVQHVGTGEARVLTDEAEARRYFETISVPRRPACPPYTDGDGAEIF